MADNWNNPPVVPHERFTQAADALLAMLADRVPLAAWCVNRQVNDTHVVLRIHDRSYGINAGAATSWGGSLCAKMVADEGPNIAPCAPAVPAFAAAAEELGMRIEAYMGYPLMDAAGETIGTLCGIDPRPQPPSIREHGPFVLEVSRILGLLLSQELELFHARLAQLANDWRAAPEIADAVRWEAVLETQEAHCQSVGSTLCCLHLELDQPRHTALDAVYRLCGDASLVAMPGPGQLAALTADTTHEQADALVCALRETLKPKRIGAAVRHPSATLCEAYREARAA